MHIEISRESVLLDTGGGLKKAAYFFAQQSSRPEEPFILHNVDVLSAIDLRRMLQFHTENHALATLAVHARKTSRYLLFDHRLQLCGRRSDVNERDKYDKNDNTADDHSLPQPLAFSGIHVISPRLLGLMTEDGAFSIIDSYLRLAAHGEKILAFRADEYYWRDLGTPENIAQAAHDLEQQILASKLAPSTPRS
jgi:NDP-sugar pyrophosphorylase family protein